MTLRQIIKPITTDKGSGVLPKNKAKQTHFEPFGNVIVTPTTQVRPNLINRFTKWLEKLILSQIHGDSGDHRG